MARRRTLSVVARTRPRCACGGMLRKISMDKYELSELGLNVVLVGKIVGYECGLCRQVSIPNDLIDQATNAVVMGLLRLDRRLAGREAAFLRYVALGYDITHFGRWRGRSRASVHRDERARSLPDTEDFVLRGLVLGRLMNDSHEPERGIDRELLETARLALQVTRHAPAPKRLERIEITVSGMSHKSGS